MKRKVSIIIPVYNVELYLEECLNSIVNQTFIDMEIILVDDGSTDRSLEIMQMFAKKDNRIKIIIQSNGGVSAARNTGLRAALSEYILFIDSDDTILPDSVETLYHKACETGSDLLLGNALFCYPDGSQSVVFDRNELLNSQVAISGEICYVQLMEAGAFPPLVYLFFIRRELIVQKKLFFKEKIIHEDELWCIKAMLNATRVTLIDFNYYLYRQREGSLMNSNNQDFRIKSLFIISKEIKKLTQRLQKERKPTIVTDCLYSKIFNLSYFINDLQWKTDTGQLNFSISSFFAKLLTELYPQLPYPKQREYLSCYYFSHPAIRRRLNSKQDE